MLLSLSTACLGHFPLRTVFALATETGFGGVELVVGPEVWLRGAGQVRSLASQHHLSIPSVHQSLVGLNPSRRATGRIVDAVNLALELGCPRVVIHAPIRAAWSQLEGLRWMEVVRLCQKRIRGTQTRLTLETPGLYPDTGAHSPEEGLAGFVEFARRHDLDITLDTCHVGQAGVDLFRAYSLVRERVANVHLSDLKRVRPLRGLGPLPLLLAHHQMPGEGILPLAEFVERLAADGCQAPLTVEVGPIALRAWTPSLSRGRLRRVRQFLTSAIERSAPRT